MNAKTGGNIDSVSHLLGYFDQQVLAGYRSESDKYDLKTDFFEAQLHTSDVYYEELDRTNHRHEAVNIRFGYRTLHDGSLAIVGWLPDLYGYQGEKSNTHIRRWEAFRLQEPVWVTGPDERFDKWVARHIEGSWEVENGPSALLNETVEVINGLTNELVRCSLYNDVPDETLGYPAAENSHRYQDSHKELYGYLIDGLNKDCIQLLAKRLGIIISIGDKTTLKALYKLLPALEQSGDFKPAVSVVSDQRRLASHKVRPRAIGFPAFSEFTMDLYRCLSGVKQLLAELEQVFGVEGAQAYECYRAKQSLPRIGRASEPHYSIRQAARMVGKTTERVEYGFREDIPGVHVSELLLLHFTDGSIMALDIGTNAQNVADGGTPINPEDFHVDFRVHWVPERPQGL